MILDKKQMTEEDIKLNFITPALNAAGWQNGTHITMEAKVTDGKINLRGNFTTREKPRKVDYLLYLNSNHPIAVVEAKDNNHTISYGMQQAIDYAVMLDLPFAYSSNGDGFQEHDFLTGQERTITLDDFPKRDDLIARYKKEVNGGEGLTNTEQTWFYRLDMPKGYKHFSKTRPMKLEHFQKIMDWWENRSEIKDSDTDTYKSKCYSVQEIADGNYNLDLCGYPHEEEEILPPKELIQQYQEKRASLNADIDRILAKITDILGIDLEEDE